MLATLALPTGTAAESDADLSDLYARAVWSVITEPCDAAAGRLTAALGHALALETIQRPDAADALASGGYVEHGDAAYASWLARLSTGAVERTLRAAGAAGIQLLHPARVRGLESLPVERQPHVLWTRGDVATLASTARSLSPVGARASTGYGEHVCGEIVGALAAAGIAVHVDLAYGIGGTAARAALAADGQVVAWMANGLDRPYPAGHVELFDRLSGGRSRAVAVSEVPPTTAPTRYRFLARARLQAAATDGTLVVEAGARSGSLHVAREAAALGRHVMAVCGPLTSPASTGANALIRDGLARLVTSAADVMGVIAR